MKTTSRRWRQKMFCTKSLPRRFPLACPCCFEKQPGTGEHDFIEVDLGGILDKHLENNKTPSSSQYPPKGHMSGIIYPCWESELQAELPYCPTCRSHIFVEPGKFRIGYLGLPLIAWLWVITLKHSTGLSIALLGMEALAVILMCEFINEGLRAWRRRQNIRRGEKLMKPACAHRGDVVRAWASYEYQKKVVGGTVNGKTAYGEIWERSGYPKNFGFEVLNRNWAEAVGKLNGGQWHESTVPMSLRLRIFILILLLPVILAIGIAATYMAIHFIHPESLSRTQRVSPGQSQLERKNIETHKLVAMPTVWSEPVIVPVGCVDIGIPMEMAKKIRLSADGEPLRDAATFHWHAGTEFRFMSTTHQPVPIVVQFTLTNNGAFSEKLSPPR